MKQKYWLALGVAVVGGSQAAACSSRFNSCSDTRTCAAAAGESSEAGAAGVHDVSGHGTAGHGGGGAGMSEGGDSGAAGEAGAGVAGGPPVRQCEHDLDCVNADPDTCVASCKNGMNGGTVCVVHGKDEDKDGYFSASCTVSPGDDCNDQNAAIHPGAPELCDRIDNDCNGLTDLGDALPLSGANVNLTTDTHTVAKIGFAPDKSVYGLALLNQSTGDLSGEIIDTKGKLLVAPKVLSQAGSKNAGDFDFIWGSNSFGVFSLGPATGVPTLSYQTFTSEGISLGLEPFVSSSDGLRGAALARTASGLWTALYEVGVTHQLAGAVSADPSNVSIAPITASIGPSGVDHLHALAVGNNVAITYDAGSSSCLLMNPAVGSTVAILPLVGRVPVAGAGPGGFAIAVGGATATDAPQIYAFTDIGKPLCGGPLKLAEPGSIPSAVVGTSNGYLVTLVSSAGVSVQEALFSCSLGEHFTLDSSASSGNAVVANNTSGSAVVWTNSTGLNFRAFGPNFCD